MRPLRVRSNESYSQQTGKEWRDQVPGRAFDAAQNKLKAMKLISLLACVSFTALAQTSASETETLQKLMTEVHQLRIALERSSQIAPRIQIAVERLKMQQEQVARVARQVDDARRDLDHFRTQQGQIQQQLQSTENASNETVDPATRKALNTELAAMKQRSEQVEKSAQEAQIHESDVASQLQSEQSKLAEFNERLNLLEHALNAPQN